MPNRFIFSLRFSTKVFAKLGLFAVTALLFMTLFRLNLYFLSVYHSTPTAVFVDVAHSFLAGLRFDLLVLGFIFVPIYFSVIVQAFLQRWPERIFKAYKAYFIIVWLVICSLTYIDFFHFSQFGARMRYADYMKWEFPIFLEQIEVLHRNQVWVFSIITLLLLSLGYSLAKNLQFGNWKDEYSPARGSKFEIFWRLVLPFVLIFLAARGTVEPHHLRLEHSEVSTIKPINEMALNAVWCFDK